MLHGIALFLIFVMYLKRIDMIKVIIFSLATMLTGNAPNEVRIKSINSDFGTLTIVAATYNSGADILVNVYQDASGEVIAVESDRLELN